MLFRLLTVIGLAFPAFSLGACGSGIAPSPADYPIPYETQGLMQLKGVNAASPIFMRIFKEESELEIWKQRDDGRYTLLKTYPICKWSGRLGPKLKQGDKQAPEGFYTVNARQMNPNSKFHLSFNLGFPNALDRSYRRTGDFLMVHGDCRSAGCYAMTDVLIEEIYALVREAFKGGQKEFHVQALPFRMSEQNMQKYARHRWADFWRDLKKGYDAFEISRIPPKISVCERRYLVNAAFSNPDIRFGASDICPPYKTFVPDIIETPEGPKIIEMPASASASNKQVARPDPAPAIPAMARVQLTQGTSLSSPRVLSLRKPAAISRP